MYEDIDLSYLPDGHLTREQWVDDHTQLNCLAKRGPMGAWCGYVAVGPDHPFYKKDYDELYEFINVHGSLTYSALCSGDPETGICHVPAPGEPDDVWWFGFDCAHSGDYVPGLEAVNQKLNLPTLTGIDRYRDINYVKDEIGHLADMLLFYSEATPV